MGRSRASSRSYMNWGSRNCVRPTTYRLVACSGGQQRNSCGWRGEDTRLNPVDRGRPGFKHHVMVDGHGVPREVQLSAANKPDVTRLVPLLACLPQFTGKVGHPQSRPKTLYGDRGYDSEQVHELLRWRGIKPFLAKRGTSHGSGLGKIRYVVERTLSWLHQQRCLRVRYERRLDIHQGFLSLAAGSICFHVFLGLC